MTIPLSILDLSPFGAGRTAADGLRDTIRLARRAEELGYSRYWLAEHHLNPGVAGASPHVLLAAIAAETRSIRLGTAATILGNYTPLLVAEAFGTLAALHPGRIDLGLGRSGHAFPERQEVADRVVDGLVVPGPRPFPFDSERFAVQWRLLGRTAGDGDAFEEELDAVLGLFAGTYTVPEGVPIAPTPAAGQDVDVWVHGSTGGGSARFAGARGLPFGANYHVAPSFVLEAVTAYREAFRPGVRATPYVTVSVDVLVAETDAEAERLAAGYGHWVHSIRAGQGAIAYPEPEWALAHPLTEAEHEVVDDRLATRFVGSPATVAARLETLRRVTAADELLVTTIAHDPADRLRSYALLSEEWGLGSARGARRAAASAPLSAAVPA